MVDWLKESRAIAKQIRKQALASRGKGGGKDVGSIGAGGDKSIVMDVEAERVVERFCAKLGNVLLVSEELGEKTFGKPSVVVVADPIDGSFNYKTGLGDFAFSMAVAKTRDVSSLEFGYVMNLVTGDEYYAFRGKGAFKNGKRLSKKNGGSRRVLFEAKRNVGLGAILASLRHLLGASRVRMMGCAAIDCCLVAEGAFDKFVFIGKARVVDVLAGKIIAEEAGCKALGFNNRIGINEKTKVEMVR